MSATATDAAGNSGTGTTTFDILAPAYPAIKALTSQLVEKAGVATQLVSYLDAASKAEARDNLRAEAGNLDSYRSLLRAQSGKSVAPAAADALIAFSSAL